MFPTSQFTSLHVLRRAVCFGTPVVLLWSLSCTERAPDVGGLQDDLGRVVSRTPVPQRIVSLSPATTEILFALGLSDRLVGRTQWDVYPPEASAVHNVGEGMPPNIEAVAATDPDLVVFYASDVNRRPIEQLAQLGIRSFSVRVDLLARLPEIISLLGEITGRNDVAREWSASFQARLDSAASAPPPADDPIRVVILTWDNPPIVIGGASFLNELVEYAGAVNVFSDLDVPSASVSIETIAERDPDVFLVTSGDEVPSYARRPEWNVLRAISQRRFAFVTGTQFEWPTTRSFDAVSQLRDALIAATGAPVVGR